MFVLTKVPTSSVVVTGLGVFSSRFSPITFLLSRPSVKGAIVTVEGVTWAVPSCSADVGRHWRGISSRSCVFDDAVNALLSKQAARILRFIVWISRKPEGHSTRGQAAAGTGNSRRVKFYLTDSQGLSLLCMSGRSKLSTVRKIQSLEHMHMNNIQVITRVAEGLLAVAATGVSVLVFQFAMLAG